MSRFLYRDGQCFELWDWSEPSSGHQPIRFDQAGALDFLRRFKADPYNMHALRNVLTWDMPFLGADKWTDEEILKQIAWRLTNGTLRIAEKPYGVLTRGGARAGLTRPEAPPPEPASVEYVDPPQQEVQWIELLYLNSDLSPVASAEYHIRSESPSFSQDGILNGEGFIHIDGIPADVSRFTFYFDHDAEDYIPHTKPSVPTNTGKAKEETVSALDEVGDWIWGTVQGDFNKDQSYSQIAVNMVIGVIPIADQILDIRDIIAGLKDIIEYYSEEEEEQQAHPDVLGLNYEVWLWISVFIIAIGCIPEVGSVVKGILKGIFRFLQDSLKKAGELSPAQLRRLWEELVRILNHFGVGNAHRWLKELPNKLDGWMDEAADKIRGALDSIQEMMTKAEQYADQLARLRVLTRGRADEIIRRARRYKNAALKAYRRLDEMKRQVNEWIREQLSHILGGKHNFEQRGTPNVRPRPNESGPNTRVQEEAPPPEYTPAIRTQRRLDELAQQGHGPQRHEGGVTTRQLEDRCTQGIDPMSGTTTDAVTGNRHRYGRHATKINTPEDYVAADDYLRNSDEFRRKLEAAEDSGDRTILVKNTTLEEIYGEDYTSRVDGRTRMGSNNNPQGAVPTDFADGTMRAVYRQNADGGWDLITMFPEPRP